jgi:pilus assembly protein Flp/PilA
MIRKTMAQLLRDQTGGTIIEYALVLGLIVFGLFIATQGIGNQVRTTMDTAHTTLSTANAAG